MSSHQQCDATQRGTGEAPATVSDAPGIRRNLENSITRRYLAQGIDSEELVAACHASAGIELNFEGRFLGRPALLEVQERLALEQDLGRMYELVRSLRDRLFHGNLARFGEAVGMTPVQVEAILRDRRSQPSRTLRADLYHDGDGFRVLELNVCSAIGGYEIAEQNRALLESEDLSRFVESERLQYVDPLRCIVDTMLADCGGGAGSSRPLVALADWPSSFITLEPELAFMAELLRAIGIEALPCHVGELERRSGGVYLRDRRVDIVYRFFLIEDLLESSDAPSLFWPILDAADRGEVALFTSLEDELYSSKASLALLSDERNDIFSPAERAVIDRLLPWTRELRDTSALVDGRTIDLVPYVLANRSDLLLKPTNLHAGAGVVAGWTCTDAEWEETVATAVNAPFIVQRRVRAVTQRFPAADGSGALEDVVLNWGVFLTNAGYSGACVRGVADADVGVVGMTAGASMGACFHVA